MQARSAIMGFKLKVLINEWFVNGMTQPIDISQADDLESYNKGSWSKGSKQRSILNLLKDETQSGVPEWMKDHVDIYFVQRLVSILMSDAKNKDSLLLSCVSTQRPIYKNLSNIKKIKNVSELIVDNTELDYAACTSFMHRKSASLTVEGCIAGEMLFNSLVDQSFNLSELKHLESIASLQPKQMVRFLSDTTESLMDIETLDEKKRLFINYCLESIDPNNRTPQRFEELQQAYPKQMDELLAWLSISPLAKFSKNVLKNPLSNFQLSSQTSRLAMLKRLSSLGSEIKELIPGQLCHPDMMTIFYKDSNKFLKTSLDLHQMELDETKQKFANTQKTPFRLSLLLALIGIGVAVLGHTTLVAASIITPIAMAIGLLGVVMSQSVLLRSFQNDPRRLKTIYPTFQMNMTCLILAATCFIAAQQFTIIALPFVLCALGAIMPFISQIEYQGIVNKHIDATPLPQTAKVKEVIKMQQLGSMFIVNEKENQVCFLKSPIDMNHGACV